MSKILLFDNYDSFTYNLLHIVKKLGYTDVEVHRNDRIALDEIDFARECSADCAVAGILTPDGRIDEARTARLVERCGSMQFTFHRAFDMTCDTTEALEAFVRAGCYRVLTSGGHNTAPQGIDTLRSLVHQAAGRIAIMAGSGVGPANVRQLAETGVDAVHFSARCLIESGMTYRNPTVSMGGVEGIPEYASVGADEKKICEILNQLTPKTNPI